MAAVEKQATVPLYSLLSICVSALHMMQLLLTKCVLLSSAPAVLMLFRVSCIPHLISYQTDYEATVDG